MKRAYRTTWNGIVSIVAAESRTGARYARYWNAVNAGYCLSLIDIRVRRAPEYDGWAEDQLKEGVTHASQSKNTV